MLELLDAAFTIGPVTVSGADNMVLSSGELALVRVIQPEHVSVFANICCGLLQPRRGSVRFLGHDWASAGRERANVLRSAIGRVFREGNWLEFLSVMDNVQLPRRHHEGTPDSELQDEAAALAEHFGLPGVPKSYPKDTSPLDLKRAACVRAFLGRPALVVLEEPTAGLYPDLLDPLVIAIRSVRNRGGAALWLTRDPALWSNPTVPADHRLRIVGSELKVVQRAPGAAPQGRPRTH